VREYVGGHARVTNTRVGSRDAGQTPTPAPALLSLESKEGLATTPAVSPIPRLHLISLSSAANKLLSHPGQ
jgi:hypothetical protein